MRDVEPYSALAAGYDLIMEHVEYEEWAGLVFELLETWGEGIGTVLELGCGTGSLALELQPLGDYRYIGTDRVESMLAVARAKARFDGADIRFEVADFTDFRMESPVDAVLLLFDGLNYLLETEGITRLLSCVFGALRPGGLFIFDLSTPANSLNNAEYFEDEGGEDEFSYRRMSRYDAESRIHATTFEFESQGQAFREVHLQRAYELDDIRPLVDAAGFETLAVLDGFTHDEATFETERAHWVVRRPIAPSPPSTAL